MATLQKIWDKIKRKWVWFRHDHDHYQRAVLIATPIAAAFLAALSFLGGLFVPQWFFDLYLAIAFPGGIMSGSSYVGLTGDRMRRSERIGTMVMGAIGIGVAVALAVLSIAVPFAGVFGKFAYALFGLTGINVLGGLGNRLGSTMDPDSDRPLNERKAIGYSAVIGAAVGATLMLKLSAVLTTSSVAMILPGITIAAALPIIPAVIIAAVVTASICASAADYSAKAWNYLQYKRGKTDETLTKRIENRKREYQGAFLGVSAGLIVGGIILAAALPYIALGIAGALAVTATIAVAAFIVVGCVAAFGSFLSKLGRYLDTRREAQKTKLLNEKKLSPSPHVSNNTDQTPPESAITPKPTSSYSTALLATSAVKTTPARQHFPSNKPITAPSDTATLSVKNLNLERMMFKLQPNNSLRKPELINQCLPEESDLKIMPALAAPAA